MTFLGGILSTVLTHLLTALAAWAAAKFHSWYQDRRDTKAAEDATKKVVDEDKAANTKEERDNAAKDVANNL